MPKVQPWHSKRPGETVCHNNTVCTEGNNVETYYLAPGTGNAPLFPLSTPQCCWSLTIRHKGDVPIRPSRLMIENRPYAPQLKNPKIVL